MTELEDTLQNWVLQPKSLDERLVSEGAKQNHYAKVASLLENTVLQEELDEWKRSIIMELALKTNGDLAIEGMRRTLIEIGKFEKRLKNLASRVKSEPIKPLEKKL